jgi:hypothetical protein
MVVWSRYQLPTNTAGTKPGIQRYGQQDGDYIFSPRSSFAVRLDDGRHLLSEASYFG